MAVLSTIGEVDAAAGIPRPTDLGRGKIWLVRHSLSPLRLRASLQHYYVMTFGAGVLEASGFKLYPVQPDGINVWSGSAPGYRSGASVLEALRRGLLR